jgi:hypothetical protein
MQIEKINVKLNLDITVDYTYNPYDKFIELDAIRLNKYPELGNILPAITDEDYDNILQSVNKLGKEWGQP